MFNYQGSSLFSLIRSSFDILSRRFLFVKNFFIFLFTVCSGSVSPSQVSFNRLSHPLSSVKNFFHFVQRSALASCPTVALRLVLFIGLSQRQVVSYHGKSELSMFFLFFIFFRTIQTIHFCFYLQHHAAHMLSFISPNTKQQPSKTLHILTLLYHK